MHHGEIAIFPNNKILFIDDDPEFTDLMVQFFEPTEFEIYIQNDSTLALKDIFDIMPFFVVLDYNMPYLNGLDVLDEIRKSSLSNMYVIFLSAYSQYKEDVLKIGANSYIIKGEESRWIDKFYDYLKNAMNNNMDRKIVEKNKNAKPDVFILIANEIIDELIEID